MMLKRSPVPVAPPRRRACGHGSIYATSPVTLSPLTGDDAPDTPDRARTRVVLRGATAQPPDKPPLNGGNAQCCAGQVCRMSASGITPLRRYAKRRRGPSMYEMEGPRAASRHRPPIARQPRAAWRLPRRPGKPIAQMPSAARHHRCQVPAVRSGRPVRAAFPRFPLGRIPSSVVRDFYCQSSPQHKAFPQELQDSLAIHRTSVVYPLSTGDFHRTMHRSVHSFWG